MCPFDTSFSDIGLNSILFHLRTRLINVQTVANLQQFANSCRFFVTVILRYVLLNLQSLYSSNDWCFGSINSVLRNSSQIASIRRDLWCISHLLFYSIKYIKSSKKGTIESQFTVMQSTSPNTSTIFVILFQN